MELMLHSSASDSCERADRSGPSGAGLWRHTVLLGGILCGLYGLLWNRYWVPETDGAVYLSVARNLFLGQGFHFNGVLPVIIPPLWPLLLAALFRLSTSFGFLHLVSLLLMVASALAWHRILLRLTRPAMAFAVVLLAAMIQDWFRLSALPFTDPAALLCLSLAVLLALQVAETGRCSWRLPLLLALICAAVLLRYAAVLGNLLVAAALVQGERRPRLHLSWLSAVLCGLCGLATLVWVRFAYSHMAPPSGYEAIQVAGGLELAAATQYSFMPTSLSGLHACLRQVVSMGTWVSSGLFIPAKMAARMPLVGWGVPLAGWALGGCFFVAAWRRVREGRWLELGAWLYIALIAVRWPDVNSRYLVPVLPLLLLGIAEGMGVVAAWLMPGVSGGTCRRLAVAFLASVGIANGALYAVSVHAARAADFYGAYRMETRQIVDIGHYLLEAGIKDGEIAVMRRYNEGGVSCSNHYALRCLVLLTGRHVRSVPIRFKTPQSAPGFLGWAGTNGVRYVVHRPSRDEDRVFGLAVPRLANWLRVQRGEAPVSVYELHQIIDGQVRRIRPPTVPDWPRCVPALAAGPGGDRVAGEAPRRVGEGDWP